MDIVFLIDTQARLQEMEFAVDLPNPGCGGTQFCTVILAVLLANARPDWRIRICSPVNIRVRNRPSNLSIQITPDKHDCLKALEPDSFLIAPVQSLARCDARLLETAAPHIIPWIHHPFDNNMCRIRVDFPAAVAVGTYQYYSIVGATSTPVHHIQNPFLATPFIPNNSERDCSGSPRICVVSSLHPAKSFHETARFWPSIRRAFPNATLSVIGGLSTYGVGELDPVVPTSRQYAEQIKTLIGEREIASQRVRFLGNLGAEKLQIIQESNVALLNPTGKSEAFPASPLECMAARVPVIAGFDFGMTDAMRFNPDLALSSPEQVVEKLKLLFKSPATYAHYQGLAIATAMYFDAQTAPAIAKWEHLLTQLARGDTVSIRPEPVLPLVDPGRLMKQRRAAAFGKRTHVRSILSKLRQFVG